MTDGTIGHGYGGLGEEFRYLRMRLCPNYKKAGRFPIREYEGPTKNLIP